MIFTTNLKYKLPQIQKDILHWKRRRITMIGRITVIKSLLISQLVHLFLSLPSPSKKDIMDIETKLFRFLWGDKNDSVKRSKIVQGLEYDGLDMIDVNSFIKSMKITWIKRLYQSQQDWAIMIQKELPPIQELLTYGTTALAKVKNKLNNPFWREVIVAWSEFCALIVPNSNQIITEKLWFNNVSKFRNGIVRSWYSKGLRFVADLINNETGILYTKQELETVYGIRMTFLCYSSLIRNLLRIMKETNYKSLIVYPLIPYKISLIHGKEKMSRIAYEKHKSYLRKSYKKSQENLEGKWVRDVNYFHVGSMQDVRTATKNTYIQTFHFRLISRIITTNKFLHTIGKAENNLCSFCCSQVETLHHLFWACATVQTFMAKISDMLSTHFGLVYQIKEETWFFPDKNDCKEIKIILYSIAKITIYSARHQGRKPSLQQFLINLKLEAEKDFHSARFANKLDKYNDKWKRLKILPELNIKDII